MALQRIDSTAQVGQAGGYTQVRLGLDSTMEAQQWAQAGQTATTMFDQLKADDDAEAIKRAQLEAPALIKEDGKGMIVPPASFSAPGGYFQSGAYKKHYEHTAFATYVNSVEAKQANKLAEIQSRNQTDVVTAQKEMTEWTNAVVSGLDPRYAPLITLRLNAMNGQTATRINANVVNEQTKVAEQNAKTDVENAILAVGDLANVPDRIDREEIAKGPNGAMLVQKIDQANASMNAAQWSKPRQEKVWQDAKVGVVIARTQRLMRDNYKEFVENNPTMDAGDIHRWQIQTIEDIETQAAKMGAHGPQFKEAMRQTMAEQSQKFGLKLAIRDDGRKKEDAIAVLEGKRRLDEAGPPDSPAAQAVIASLQAQRLAVYGRNDLSPAETIARLAAFDTVIKPARSELSEYAYSQVQSLYSQATAVGTTPIKAKENKAEIQRIIDDPIAGAMMSPAVRNAGQRAVAALALNEAKIDMSVGLTDGANGNLDPKTSTELLQKWTDKGYLNNLMNPLEAAQWKAKSDAAYMGKEIKSASAQRAVQDFAQGKMPDAQSAKDLDELLPSLNRLTGSTFDFEKPGHTAAMIGRMGMAAGQIPAEAVAQFKSVPMGNQKKSEAAAAAYQEIQKFYESNGFSKDATTAMLNASLGGMGNFLKDVIQYDHKQALKNVLDNATPSVGRQAGQSKTAMVPELEAGMEEALKDVNNNGGLTFGNIVLGNETSQQRATSALNPAKPGAFDYLGRGLNPLNRDPTLNSYNALRMAPELQQRVLLTAQKIMMNDGLAIKTANPGVNPNKIAFMQAMAAHKDEYEASADPANPKNGLLDFKSANSILSGALGVPVDKTGNNGWSRGHWMAYQQARVQAGLGETTIAPIDFDTVQTQRFTDRNGESVWVMAAQYKEGHGAVELMRFQNDDPRISAYNKTLLEATDKDLYKHWYGKSGEPDQQSRMFMAGVVSGKTFTWANAPLMKAAELAGDAVKNTFAGTVRSANIAGRLEQGAYTPYPAAPGMGHYTKQIIDAIFEGETIQSAQPLIQANPFKWLGGVIPRSNMDPAKIAKSLKESGDADLEYRSQTLHLLQQMRPGVATWNPANPAPTSIPRPSPLGKGDQPAPYKPFVPGKVPVGKPTQPPPSWTFGTSQ